MKKGSGFQGDSLMHELYLNLGTVEVEDQIAVARFVTLFLRSLKKNFGFYSKKFYRTTLK